MRSVPSSHFQFGQVVSGNNLNYFQGNCSGNNIVESAALPFVYAAVPPNFPTIGSSWMHAPGPNVTPGRNVDPGPNVAPGSYVPYNTSRQNWIHNDNLRTTYGLVGANNFIGNEVLMNRKGIQSVNNHIGNMGMKNKIGNRPCPTFTDIHQGTTKTNPHRYKTHQIPSTRYDGVPSSQNDTFGHQYTCEICAIFEDFCPNCKFFNEMENDRIRKDIAMNFGLNGVNNKTCASTSEDIGKKFCACEICTCLEDGKCPNRYYWDDKKDNICKKTISKKAYTFKKDENRSRKQEYNPRQELNGFKDRAYKASNFSPSVYVKNVLNAGPKHSVRRDTQSQQDWMPQNVNNYIHRANSHLYHLNSIDPRNGQNRKVPLFRPTRGK